ncbi:MAG TPA: hypothetical protein VKN63_07335 [Afifellaceae bacterium]|nr:hypothetical protein [Afifellaceae bacterium]
MDFLNSVFESGDIKWMIPALVGALIVLLGLVRLLFSETVGWALALLIVFGGVLSGVSVIAHMPPGASPGLDVKTAAVAGEAGGKLKDAIRANTQAIERVQSAVSEIRAFTEMLAAATSEVQGDLALTSVEIDRYKGDVETLLTDTTAAIDRSKDAEQEAVRTLDTLNQTIQAKLREPAQ